MDVNVNEAAFLTDNHEVYLAAQRVAGDGVPGDTYLAFQRHENISQPVCHITIGPLVFGTFRDVLWVEVSSEHRREGIATEVLLGLQQHVGPLVASGVTEAGKAFMAGVWDKLHIPKVYEEEYLRAQGIDESEWDSIQREAHRKMCLGVLDFLAGKQQ